MADQVDGCLRELLLQAADRRVNALFAHYAGPLLHLPVGKIAEEILAGALKLVPEVRERTFSEGTVPIAVRNAFVRRVGVSNPYVIETVPGENSVHLVEVAV